MDLYIKGNKHKTQYNNIIFKSQQTFELSYNFQYM